jgi:integrase/recombinase XerC
MPRPIPDDDLVLALEHAEPPVRAFLLLGAYQGLRAGEIGALAREEVLDAICPPMLLVRNGKGRKERLLPLHPAVATELACGAYPRSGPLFPGLRAHDGRAGWEVSHMVNAHLHALGITSTCHSLRHWFLTGVYRASNDLRLTQEMAGHSSPTTTAAYAAWSPGKAVPVVTGLRVGPDA